MNIWSVKLTPLSSIHRSQQVLFMSTNLACSSRLPTGSPSLIVKCLMFSSAFKGCEHLTKFHASCKHWRKYYALWVSQWLQNLTSQCDHYSLQKIGNMWVLFKLYWLSNHAVSLLVFSRLSNAPDRTLSVPYQELQGDPPCLTLIKWCVQD